MQICQQFINLLIRKYISKAVHLISAYSNDVLDAIIVCWHAADGKLFALKQAFQARPLPFLRRIRQMATVAILIVDVTASRLARGQSELGIALAPLNLASGSESDQKDRHARQPSDIQASDVKKLAGKKNSSHQKLSADQFIYTASQIFFAYLAIPARILRDFHTVKFNLHRSVPNQILQKCSKTAAGLDMLQTATWAAAQILLHTPVNQLHSIESKAYANSIFLLTQILEGVKP
jgi:hypothetical protein